MTSLLRVFSPKNLRHLGRDRCGAASIESALLAALIGVAVIVAAAEIGSKVSQVFDSTAQMLEQTVNLTTGKCGPGNGNGNCANPGNGGGNTGGSGPGTGNGDDDVAQSDRGGTPGKGKDKNKRKDKKKGKDKKNGKNRDRDRDRD